MATYASSSNPFIRLDEGSPKRKGAKKDAPGMAKLESSILKQDEPNLLMNDDYSPTNSSTPSLSDSMIGKNEDKKVSLNFQPINNDLNELNGNESFEIARACQSLVEMTVRMELDEKKFDIACDKGSGDAVASTEAVSKDPSGNLITNDGDYCKESDFNQDEEEVEVDLDLGPAPMERDDRRQQHMELIKKLRLQLRDLERYAFERGELDQVPASVIAERQSVILDTLQNRLSLNINRSEIERLDLDELKKQVDKEIHELIDPLKDKEHLVAQLKTQLVDLERYISHLHGTIGKIHDKRNCSCKLHGCSSIPYDDKAGATNNDSLSDNDNQANNSTSSLLSDDALPKSTKLIRSLVTQLICSDVKLRDRTKKVSNNDSQANQDDSEVKGGPNNQNVVETSSNNKFLNGTIRNQPQFNDQAAWCLHIDRVILATDSLVNLFTCGSGTTSKPEVKTNNIDEGLIESIIRRQLVPAIRDLLSYGIIDPNSIPKSNSYVSILFDPYYILSSLTCFPGTQKPTNQATSQHSDKIHVWNIVEDYYNSKNEPLFKSSSAKTLSQSFNLAPSISGQIKITSKQALLIAVEDIIETLSNCKPNGPDSHFRAFIYSALNRQKLPTWLRLIFKNKWVNRKYYFNFSFTSQPEKMDKLLRILDALTKFQFNLRTDVESIEQFVSAF